MGAFKNLLIKAQEGAALSDTERQAIGNRMPCAICGGAIPAEAIRESGGLVCCSYCEAQSRAIKIYGALTGEITRQR